MEARKSRRGLVMKMAIALLLFGIVFAAGAASEYHFTREQPYRNWTIKLGIAKPERSVTNMFAIAGAAQVDCGKPEQVVLIVGQSNVANMVTGVSGDFPASVLNYFDGHCYRAQDPLLGSTGRAGSLWSHVEWPRSAVLVPLAVGGTRIQEWSPGGPLFLGLSAEIDRLKALGLAPTHIFIHQGEEDAMEATDPAVYERAMGQLLSALKQRSDARIVVGLTSFCRGVRSEAILSAQRNAAAAAGVETGPNTDLLGDADRSDNCHLNERGAKAAAAQWQEFLN